MNLSAILLLGLLAGPFTPLPLEAFYCRPRQNPDCTRGAAEPVLKKSVYPKARFQLQPDKISGVETVSFANGDRLIIRNWGCEYYVLTFRFETSRFRQDTTARTQWYRHGITLLTELLPGLRYPLNIKEGVAAMRRATDRGRTGAHDPEIEYGGEGSGQTVAVDRIQKLPSGRYAVEISFAQLL